MDFEPEVVEIESLTPHPRNYRYHDELQMEHLRESIKVNGFYRNVVIAEDGTILAGHGVVEAAKDMGYKEIPVIRLPFGPDSPEAIRVMTGDNEISRLAMTDDRQLTELLKEIREDDIEGLLGTGFDDHMLAALVMVSRPSEEIEDFDAAAEWVGMPEYGNWSDPLKLVVQFDTLEDREKFAKLIGVELSERARSCWWPPRGRQDLASLIFEG
jgi:hypothetical protein